MGKYTDDEIRSMPKITAKIAADYLGISPMMVTLGMRNNVLPIGFAIKKEDRYSEIEQLKTLIWRYFISYWNNRRICSANGGLPPMIKRQQYYDSLPEAA